MVTIATRFRRYQDVAAVEHDEAGKPIEGREVRAATVTIIGLSVVVARYEDGTTGTFYKLTGWQAFTSWRRWRLVPLCRCESPILGEPVTDPDDPTGEEFCGPDCVTTAAESSHGAFAARERD